jgi:hypothetical protein
MPAYPKPPPRQKKQGGGLKRTSQLVAKKEMRQVSERRRRKLEAAGIPLNGSTFAQPSGVQRMKRVGTYVRNGKPFRKARAVPKWGEKARRVLRKVGDRGRRLALLDAAWVAKVREDQVACIITGAVPGQGLLPVDADHAYPKQAHPKRRHDPTNGNLLRRDLHELAHRDAAFRKALQRVADERLSYAQRHRDRPVTRSEARSIIFQMAPKVRKYMRAEESA